MGKEKQTWKVKFSEEAMEKSRRMTYKEYKVAIKRNPDKKV